jgi:hypothetical protein
MHILVPIASLGVANGRANCGEPVGQDLRRYWNGRHDDKISPDIQNELHLTPDEDASATRASAPLFIKSSS